MIPSNQANDFPPYSGIVASEIGLVMKIIANLAASNLTKHANHLALISLAA